MVNIMIHFFELLYRIRKNITFLIINDQGDICRLIFPRVLTFLSFISSDQLMGVQLLCVKEVFSTIKPAHSQQMDNSISYVTYTFYHRIIRKPTVHQYV